MTNEQRIAAVHKELNDTRDYKTESNPGRAWFNQGWKDSKDDNYLPPSKDHPQYNDYIQGWERQKTS